ncbi:MAG: hypothetical protein HYW50_02710 [Candidatus Diapherotrites archaeon]|nr:hypothetical protein [Candidatus Diapherotrites archaeon]
MFSQKLLVFLFASLIFLFGCAAPPGSLERGEAVNIVPAPVGEISSDDRAVFEVDETECESGENAVPQVGFSWKWGEIDEAFCDEKVLDETQFSICLLKKINSFIENRAQQTSNAFEFEAHLMRVKFSDDFRSDFHDYYTNVNFLDTPSFYKDGEIGEWFSDTQKFVFGATEILTPGKYMVTVTIPVQESEQLTVEFEQLEIEGFANNAFYYLNFNGDIGQTDTGVQRDSYGLGYNSIGDAVQVGNEFSLSSANFGEGSFSLDVLKLTGHKQLNLDRDTRGIVLKVAAQPQGTKRELQVSFSMATPVLLQASASSISNARSVDLLYNSFTEGGQEFFSGESLLLWQPLDVCLDFGGRNEWVVDSRNEGDPPSFVIHNDLSSLPSNQRIGGNVYYKTVVYSEGVFTISPIGISKDNRLVREGLEFKSAVGSAGIGQKLPMIGTFNVHFNYLNDNYSNFEEIFELLKDGIVCIEKKGNQNRLETTIRWNEPKLFEFIGTQLDVAGQNCNKVSETELFNALNQSLSQVSSELDELEQLIAQEPVQVTDEASAQRAVAQIRTILAGISDELDEIGLIISREPTRIQNAEEAERLKQTIKSSLDEINSELDEIEQVIAGGATRIEDQQAAITQTQSIDNSIDEISGQIAEIEEILQR